MANPPQGSISTTDPIMNGAVYRVVGMSRSGNHAIIHWILRQLSGRWCFLNCAEPGTNPFETARPMDNGAVHLSSDPGFDPQRAAAGERRPNDHLLLSHEDVFLRPLFKPQAEREFAQFLGGWHHFIDILILRDPFNLFASRRRSGLNTVSRATEFRIWKQHARAFLGKSKGVPRSLVAISYNRWASDAAYREALAARLGLDFTDEGIDQIVQCLGGSSFDGLAFDGQATRMPVLDRWRHYAADADFRTMFDAETRALAEEAFGLHYRLLAQKAGENHLSQLGIPAMN